jgi:hypothetical protein
MCSLSASGHKSTAGSGLDHVSFVYFGVPDSWGSVLRLYGVRFDHMCPHFGQASHRGMAE